MPRRTDPSWRKLSHQPNPARVLLVRVGIGLFVLTASVASAAGILILAELYARDITQRVHDQMQPCAEGQQFSYTTGAACESADTP